MPRLLLTREARERCPHDQDGASVTDAGVCFCRQCGLVFHTLDDQDGEPDWPATERADREDIEAMGQGRLDLE